jgi:hypothetical protein
MKSLRNKVILSGIVLLFAFIATIGSTYAWFTVSTTTEVDTMTLNVTAAENLLIRVKGLTEQYSNPAEPATYINLYDPNNYKSYVSITDLYNGGYMVDNTQGTPWRLQPSTVVYDPDTLSTPGKTIIAFKDPNNRDDLTIYNSTTNPTGDLEYATSNSNNGHYIKLEFWMFSQSETPTGVELSGLTIDATRAALGNLSQQQAVDDAVRISVWLDDTAYSSGTGTNGPAYLFGNDEDYSFNFNDEIANAIAPVGSDTNFPVFTPTEIASASNPELFTVDFDTPTLITVLIYIEGWDMHASNNIILAAFDIAFGFKYVG